MNSCFYEPIVFPFFVQLSGQIQNDLTGFVCFSAVLERAMFLLETPL